MFRHISRVSVHLPHVSRASVLSSGSRCFSITAPATRKKKSCSSTEEASAGSTATGVDGQESYLNEVSPARFQQEVESIKKRVTQAVSSMQPLNEGFSVSTGEKGELVIHTGRGKYSLYEDHGRRVLVLQSYFSGYHNYFFDVEQKLWLSIKDGHDFRGLLTRDLMRHCNGCPDFN